MDFVSLVIALIVLEIIKLKYYCRIVCIEALVDTQLGISMKEIWQ